MRQVLLFVTMKRQSSAVSGTPVNWRIPKDLMQTLQMLAKRETRTINGQAVVLLRKAVDITGILPEPPKVQAAPAPKPVPKPPPLPPKKMEEIVNSQDGWEGSNPAALLGGTKVTI